MTRISFFDAECRPIPACYQSTMEAQEAYHAACQAGFDGDYNSFLEMETYHIRRDQAVNAIRLGAQDLLSMGERALLRGIAGQILNEAS